MIVKFDWNAFKAVWLNCDPRFKESQQIGLLHNVRDAHLQPSVSVELDRELLPVNTAVMFLLELEKQNQDPVGITALRFAVELSAARKYSHHHIRASEKVSLELMVALTKLGRNFYELQHTNRKFVNLVRFFLEQYNAYYQGKFTYPQKPSPVQEPWVDLCVVSGNMELLEKVHPNSEPVVTERLRRMITEAGLTKQKWPEILRGPERTDVISFNRRWIITLLMFEARTAT